MQIPLRAAVAAQSCAGRGRFRKTIRVAGPLAFSDCLVIIAAKLAQYGHWKSEKITTFTDPESVPADGAPAALASRNRAAPKSASAISGSEETSHKAGKRNRRSGDKYTESLRFEVGTDNII